MAEGGGGGRLAVWGFEMRFWIIWRMDGRLARCGEGCDCV